jgi:hypothetical protein
MSTDKALSALRTVLKTGSLVFGLSAAFLAILPRIFTDLLGLAGSAELDWAMRMIGITLVALAGNMLVVSIYGSDIAVIQSARVMQISAFGLGVLTLLIPAPISWFVTLYSLTGFGFSICYTIFLLRKRGN